jgi:hypothetical protein
MNKLLMKILAVLNLSEGFIHIATAGISFWGMFSLGMWDWRVATSPTADLALGVVSLITGVALHQWHSHPKRLAEPGPVRCGTGSMIAGA